MARHRRLLFVAFLMVILAATPAFASGTFSSALRGGHGLHHRFHRHRSHLGRHFSFGGPHQHRFGQHFGVHRNPPFFHSPLQHLHVSPHMRRR
jgi:hypothetical protein